jgi:hypothetical protein
MTAVISGTRDGADWPGLGGVVDVPNIEGAELIANGFARAVEQTTKPIVEKAVAPKPETRKGLTKASMR